MLKGDISMCVGIRDRLIGLPKIILMADTLMVIGGERAIKRNLLNNIPEKFTENFTIEISLNYYCRLKNLPVKYVKLEKLSHVIKENKWGLLRGLFSRLKMIWQMIKIRIILLISKKEFK
jgi:hypothetical protein